MPGPGEYRPDPTEGTTRIDDLPKPKVACQSRNYRRRPCPRCGHSSYRDRLARRTLHDLGNPLTGRPRDIVLIYSQHYCTSCRKYFNADMTDLADPGSHYTLEAFRHPVAVFWRAGTELATHGVNRYQDADAARAVNLLPGTGTSGRCPRCA